MAKWSLAVGMAVWGLAVAGCAAVPAGPDNNHRLADDQARQRAQDVAQCAQAHGRNAEALRQCMNNRAAARQAQARKQRESLRQRQKESGQTSCRNPITQAMALCQEI